MTAQVRRVEEMGETVAEAHLRNGPAVDETLDLGEELGVDPLVTGSRGLGTGREARHGERLRWRGPPRDPVGPESPRRRARSPPSRIVIGVDLYEESKGAARLGVELGKLLEGEVHLVLAYPRFPQFSIQRVAAQSEAWASEDGVRQAQAAFEDFAAELEREGRCSTVPSGR